MVPSFPDRMNHLGPSLLHDLEADPVEDREPHHVLDEPHLGPHEPDVRSVEDEFVRAPQDPRQRTAQASAFVIQARHRQGASITSPSSAW
jgi:hypothetical protein